MINSDALLKVSYGLYLITSGDKENANGYISNTFFQVSSEPPKFACTCNKDNYTAGYIKKYKCFAASVLHTETPQDIFNRFGYKSGKDFDKLKGMEIKYGDTGVPIVLNDSMAYLEVKVEETIDVGTHYIFIGSLQSADIIDDSKTPIDYLYYRENRKALSPKNAPTYNKEYDLSSGKDESDEKNENGRARYKCSVCGYIYDESKEDVRFEDLPDDWECPQCGSPKKDFIKI